MTLVIGRGKGIDGIRFGEEGGEEPCGASRYQPIRRIDNTRQPPPLSPRGFVRRRTGIWRRTRLSRRRLPQLPSCPFLSVEPWGTRRFAAGLHSSLSHSLACSSVCFPLTLWWIRRGLSDEKRKLGNFVSFFSFFFFMLGGLGFYRDCDFFFMWRSNITCFLIWRLEKEWELDQLFLIKPSQSSYLGVQFNLGFSYECVFIHIFLLLTHRLLISDLWSSLIHLIQWPKIKRVCEK